MGTLRSAALLPRYQHGVVHDAHKLAGRKLEIARLCVLASKIHVIAASKEQRIPPNLRADIMESRLSMAALCDPQKMDRMNGYLKTVSAVPHRE